MPKLCQKITPSQDCFYQFLADSPFDHFVKLALKGLKDKFVILLDISQNLQKSVIL